MNRQYVGIAISVVVGIFLILAAILLAIGPAFMNYDVERWYKRPHNPPHPSPLLAKDSLKVPDDLSDGEIRQMVESLFRPEDDDWNKVRLEMVGDRAVPMLIEALNDPRMPSTKFEGQMFVKGESPLQRVVELLSPYGPPEAAFPLAKLVDHEESHFRLFAGYGLGNIGTTECIDPVVKLLADEDDDVRHWTMRGMEEGWDAQRLSKSFQEATFGALCKLLDKEDSALCDLPPKLLIKFNPDRAVPILLSEDFFHANNPELADIVEALNEAHIRIPLERSKPLIHRLKSRARDVKSGKAYARLLIAYGKNPDDDAEPLFREELDNQEFWTADAAAEALMELSGIRDPVDYILELSWSAEREQMTRPQRVYLLAWTYDAEVQNGGHLQYFTNTMATEWREALAALREIGASQSAKVLEDAIAQHDGSNQEFGQYDERHYSSDESVHRLLMLYVIRHPDHFKPDAE